jgi:hypothetical protein
LDYEQQVTFYVRLRAGEEAKPGGGEFDLIVRAAPIE